MTEPELLIKLRQNDEWAFNQVYKETYPMVLKYIRNNKGNTEDAEDVFQEVLIAFIKKINNSSFELTSKLSTYLFSIAKNLWLYRLRSRKEVGDLEGAGEIIDEGLEDLIHKQETDEKLDIIANAMNDLKEDCRRLLIDFYYLKKALKEIAESMHVTDGFVRVKKGRCLEYFREIVKRYT